MSPSGAGTNSFTLKNVHQSSTVLLAQLGAELNTKIVYSPETTIEGPAGSEYWTSNKKQACINRILEKDAVEVVIKHKWRNVMTLMLSRNRFYSFSFCLRDSDFFKIPTGSK